MSDHQYQIFTEKKHFFVNADDFKINKDEGTITFYDCDINNFTRSIKAVFILNNIIGIYKEDNKNVH